jgi:hypothetical protein
VRAIFGLGHKQRWKDFITKLPRVLMFDYL